MDGLMVAIVVAALIIGALLMIFIQLTSRGRGQIDKEMYQRVWRQILRNVETRKSESMQMAIMRRTSCWTKLCATAAWLAKRWANV